MKKICIFIKDIQADAILDIRTDLEITKSELIRTAIDEYLLRTEKGFLADDSRIFGESYHQALERCQDFISDSIKEARKLINSDSIKDENDDYQALKSFKELKNLISKEIKHMKNLNSRHL